MILTLVRFSIRRPGVVIGLAALLLAYGFFMLTRASLDVFPEFSPVQVVIQTEAPGMSAELSETLVTRPIEAAIAGVSGLKVLRSQSIAGLSVVTAIFADGTDITRNRQMVAERVSNLAGQLPPGIIPALTPLTSSASTVLGIGVTSKTRSLEDLRTAVDWTLRSHLLSTPGVADVNVFGGRVTQWQIQVIPDRLVALGLSLQDVLAAAQKATGLRGAGFIENGNQRIILSSEGQPRDPEALGQSVIANRGDQTVRLSDVAYVKAAPAPSISGASINGTPGVFLLVQGQLGSQTRAVTEALEKSVGEMAPLLKAQGIDLQPRLFRPANFIETAVSNVQRDIAIGSVLVVVVLFLFLYNVRTAVISAMAIPLSLIAATTVLQYFKVPLNIMVLGGLAIALGEVVDDAIIDTENIYRRLRENGVLPQPRPLPVVVLDASMEVRSSVVFATFIVALVFLPLLTLSGVAGKLFAPLGLAYICAILSSLAVAITVTPALATLLLARGARLPETDPPLIAWIRPRYEALLRAIERQPRRVMAAIALGLTLGIGLLPLFSGEFIPRLREGHFVLHMTLIPGTSEAETLRVGNQLSDAIRKIRGVQSVAQWVGRAPNGADTFGTHYSEFEIELAPLSGAEQDRVLNGIRALASEKALPGGNFAVNTFLTERIEETVAGYPAALVINLHGPNLDDLDRDARKVAAALSTVTGARDVQVQAPPGIPQLTLHLDSERMLQQGVMPADALEAIEAAFQGVRVGQVTREERGTSVVVTLDPREKQRLSQVGQLLVRGGGGKLVPLADIAAIHEVSGRYKILHLAGQRLQTVTANVAGRDLDAFERDVRQALQGVALAPGDFLAYSGESRERAAARQDLIVHSLVCGVGILLLLYMAFGNLRIMAITLLNLPFALIGGVVAVLFTGGWLSLGSLVGFVTLFGITLRNSIMLVSHYQHLTEVDGLPWNADTARLGAAERLPSILMTALVTALGLLPLALGSGEPGREIEGPMASIIVGGLVTSTVLNLVVLPTVLLHYGKFKNNKEPIQ
jgi:CzcA family heavy metal efflux pump